MIEFVGSKEILDFAKEEGFKTIRMTFEDKSATDREAFNVFEVSEEEFEKMCNYEDDYDIHIDGEDHPAWKDSWGWWRHTDGCSLVNHGTPTTTGKINHNRLIMWYDENNLYYREDDGYGNEWLIKNDSYYDIFDYCLEMWGASTEKNVTAIAIGLAKLNNMSLANLFSITT